MTIPRYEEGSPETNPVPAVRLQPDGVKHRAVAPRRRRRMPIGWTTTIIVVLSVLAFALLVLGAVKVFEIVAPEPVTPASVEHPGAPKSLKLALDPRDWLYKP